MSAQDAILNACAHRDRASCETSLQSAGGGTGWVCCDCWNAGVAARKAERKAELAARSLDCVRCGRKPHTWIFGGWKLCGACRRAVEQEHFSKAARLGVFALTLTRPLVDTSGWAGMEVR